MKDLSEGAKRRIETLLPFYIGALYILLILAILKGP